ncbi:MAG TPA: outer membrane beta-barrel protein [Longimicrobium sp.]|nr:outer membrane beta-barrel protein [Longimicrobium sp.]
MRKTLPLFVAAALALAAGTAQAQSGFALKGHYLFNASDADEDQTPAADGFSVGAELVLPFNLGVGVSAYTTGKARDVDEEATAFGVLAEANYFIDLPLIPVTPYVGVHAGLGQYTIEDVSGGNPDDPEFEDSRTQLGWQVGARFQLNSLLGLDAQYRRVSESASESQGGNLERNQFLIGVTVF